MGHHNQTHHLRLHKKAFQNHPYQEVRPLIQFLLARILYLKLNYSTMMTFYVLFVVERFSFCLLCHFVQLMSNLRLFD